MASSYMPLSTCYVLTFGSWSQEVRIDRISPRSWPQRGPTRNREIIDELGKDRYRKPGNDRIVLVGRQQEAFAHLKQTGHNSLCLSQHAPGHGDRRIPRLVQKRPLPYRLYEIATLAGWYE